MRDDAAQPVGITQRRRRARILDATSAIAADGGYDAVTMRVVAERAAVSVATLYRYFPSKHHLLLGTLGHWLEVFDRSQAVHHPLDQDRSVRLWRVVDAMFGSLCGEPRLTEAMVRAYAVADATTGVAAEHVRLHLSEIFAEAIGGRFTTARDRAVGELLGDVWAANILAVAQHRVAPDECRRRLASTVRLLTAQGANDTAIR